MPTTLSSHPRSGSGPVAREAESIGTDDSTTLDVLSEDDVFDVLGANRRRITLRYLDANGGGATIDALAEHVAAVENDVDGESISPTQRKRAYIALYQMHLPKMADHGVITYDRERGHVRLRQPARAVLPHLSCRPAPRPPGTEDVPRMATSVWARLRRLFCR